MGWPHDMQNRAAPGFSVPQLEQTITLGVYGLGSGPSPHRAATRNRCGWMTQRHAIGGQGLIVGT